FYSMAIMGVQPIGSLLAGIVADRIGSQKTIFYGALLCLAGALWLAVKRRMLAEHIRPIYIERGIIVDLAAEEGR
ncbi:MAG: MFS transporter, partial [Thermoanaerobaculia bacterium]